MSMTLFILGRRKHLQERQLSKRVRFYNLLTMSGRGMVVVRTAEQEMELSVERGCTGKVLFDQVVRIVGIREVREDGRSCI